MASLSQSDLTTLIGKRNGQCVSIFMPTYREAVTAQQDPIRLKNLAKQAEERVMADGMRPPAARQLLEPVLDLVQQPGFWEPQTGGLAVFRSSDLFLTYRLPMQFTDQAIVANRFEIKPLLPLLVSEGEYLVLAMSQKQVRLLRCTRDSAGEVELKGMPKSRDEALQYDEFAKTTQLHTFSSTQGGRGGREAMFHGQGSVAGDAKAEILQYFQQVDAGLHKVLAAEQAPMVFAGVEYLFPIYQEANSYPHLMDQLVAGNPDGKNNQELRDQAWSIVEPAFQKARQGALDRFKSTKGAGGPKASDKLEEVVLGAMHGRVDTLFVSLGTERWGKADPDANTVEVHSQTLPGDEELLNLAAGQAYLNRGTLYALEPAQMPGGAAVAALFRY